MKTIKLSNDKTIEIKNKTVKIQEEYQDKLLEIENCKTEIEQLKFLRETNKFLVNRLTGLSFDEINELDLNDYNKILKEVGVIVNIDESFDKIGEEMSELEKKKQN